MTKQSVVEEKKRKRMDSETFDAMKRTKKNPEKTPEEIRVLVEKVVEDYAHQLNRDGGGPAVNKLKKLPLLTEVFSKKSFQIQFLDHALKKWLEPLPDGTLPSADQVRRAVLSILADFPISVEHFRKSRIGNVVSFLSEYEGETVSNRRAAQGLIDRWLRMLYTRNSVSLDVPTTKRTESRAEVKACQKKPITTQAVTRPEPASLDYAVRPQSKYNPEDARGYRRGEQVLGKRGQRIDQRLKQMKRSRKMPLQAAKLSAEGRRMVF